MSRRTLVLIPVFAAVLLGATASVASPWNSTSTISGIRPVSQQENSNATKYWSEHTAPKQSKGDPSTATTGSTTETTEPAPTSSSPAVPAQQPPDTAQEQQLTANNTNGIPAVGALFATDDQGDDGHFCSASVVASPHGDVVLTAAHCIYDATEGDYDTDIVFIPDYHNGQAPYGVWTPESLIVDPRWISDADPDLDFGFMIVHQAGSDRSVQSETGANQLGTNLGFDQPIQVTGYPDGASQPVTCATTSSQQDTYQMQFDCDGFPNGTSGSPWVTNVNPSTGLGTVIGVIGGYEQGGDTPAVSYSSYFDQDVQDLYNTSVDQS
ncbi:MAG TPA: trypsin-like peptidase domain-containing protein [Pseudonocardiaceae bacterium]|nr:trypsin-like peptidase domain-containing protein [Pseudonocardiaceae bacterium]